MSLRPVNPWVEGRNRESRVAGARPAPRDLTWTGGEMRGPQPPAWAFPDGSRTCGGGTVRTCGEAM